MRKLTFQGRASLGSPRAIGKFYLTEFAKQKRYAQTNNNNNFSFGLQSPFGRRCCAIHDPRVQGPEECPSWLPAATSKTSAQIIMDPLYIHYENAIHQENPLIPQTIWDGCRPSFKNKCYDNCFGENKMSTAEYNYIAWMDTYRLVCNAGVRAFRDQEKIRNPKTFTELQRLCCVVSMDRGQDSNCEEDKDVSSSDRIDYIFSPTHSIMNELCMILRVKYFLLLDVDYSKGNVCVDDIVREISEEEYKDRTRPWSSKEFPFSPSKVVKVHKLAFGPKGDHFANISFWFDEEIIPLEQSEIKRIRRAKQKNKTSIRNGHTRPHANGFLVSCTSSADFACNRSLAFDPFVPMIPAEDNSFVESLVDAIMMHRVNYLISKNLPLELKSLKEKELAKQMDDAMHNFFGYWDFFNRWVWPKRKEMESVNALSMAPSKNSIHYEPSTTNTRANQMCKIWRSFVGQHDANADPLQLPMAENAKRLKVFRSMQKRVDTRSKLPKLGTGRDGGASKPTEAWDEIVLGKSVNGINKWETTKRIHEERIANSQDAATISRSNMPLSTVPFVQN